MPDFFEDDDFKSPGLWVSSEVKKSKYNLTGVEKGQYSIMARARGRGSRASVVVVKTNSLSKERMRLYHERQSELAGLLQFLEQIVPTT